MQGTRRLLLVLVGALGVLALLVGLWALSSWQHFHASVASHTGPANHHYIRDVGAAYTTAGMALLVAVARPRWRAPLVGSAAVFLSLHAAVHVYETAIGEATMAHLAVDTPGVLVPALITAVLFVIFARQETAS